MMNRWMRGLWILLLLGATFAATQAQPTATESCMLPLVITTPPSWMLPLVVIMWIVTVAALIPSPARRFVGVPLHGLRARPIYYWLALLIYIFVAIILWLVPYQPTNGRQLAPVEFVYIAGALWLFVFLIAYDIHEPEARAMGAKLGKNKLTGVMVTLTTIVIILISGEAYLRIFYITTDGYAFTDMNYWWYMNYGWAHLNSLCYRDYEPMPDAPGLTRIAVLGDSFVMGHGINNIDDTFPQLLEKKLGAGYDVDVVAASGWDSDVELENLQNYKYRPNIVIWSYYLNDIDYLMQGDRNPDLNFTFPENPILYNVIIDFFLPNYIYYNLLQFTSASRTSKFATALIDAHMDDSLWTPQKERLQQYVDWMRGQNMRLIVLLWPQLAEVKASIPATQRVRDFFESQGVQVVDMTDVLLDKSVGEITVNRFDAHPSIEAHRLAAEQLYAALQQPAH